MKELRTATKDMEFTGCFYIREFDINQRMEGVKMDEEKELYRYIKKNLVNHLLTSERQFYKVMKELRTRINDINGRRLGRGHYLHIDGVLPTDHTIGWITITYLDVPRARACVTIVNFEGKVITGDEDAEC